MEIKDEFAKSTLNLLEAARLLGFKGTERLRQKIREGAIRGFKIGKTWMIRKEVLIALIEEEENKNLMNGEKMEGLKEWQFQRRKTVPTGIHASQSAASECRNLRAQLREKKRKSTKIKDGER